MMFKSIDKYFLLLPVFLIFGNAIHAQVNKTTFSGIVIDETNQPVPGVTLMVLHAADSVLAQFGSSDDKGSFVLKNIPKGSYLLNVSFLGMETLYQPLTAGNQELVNLGYITLKASATMLSEIEVTGDIIPIEIKKDTISYNADAFQTQPNADVEELLKKLPGIEVQPDGSIKAQGEDVQKVLVDGKEFFGDDPKMATKNLPAKAIKRVKVYDKKSDIAEFTGVDDGEREKTIDLQLKEEFKKGLFGKAEAGYGTDSRYNTKASFNKFNKSSQLSFLGQLNNINQQGFSFSEQMGFSGGGMRGGGGRNVEFRMAAPDIPMAGTANGLTTTGAGGMNFNYHKNKSFNFRTSYFYNHVNKSLLEEAFRQNFADNPFDTDTETDEISGNQSHRINLNAEIKPDTVQEFNINGRINFDNGDLEGESELENFIGGQVLESRSMTSQIQNSNAFSINSSGTYVRRFGNFGQNIAATLTVNKSNNDNNNTLNALTEYFNTGDEELLNQLQFGITDNFQWSGQLSFTQPLKKRRFLEFNYFYSASQSDFDKLVSDVINQDPVPNPDLSNTYTHQFNFHRPGVTFRYSGEAENLNISLHYQLSDLSGEDNTEVLPISKTYKHILPRVIWRKDIASGKNLRFSYSTRINSPSVNQLSPSVDNSDPLRLYAGNPDLNAEYVHNLNFNLHSFTQFTSTSLFASVSATFTKNKIITSKTYDADRVEFSKPVNINDEASYSAYASFGRPVKWLHSRFNVNARLNTSKTGDVIDNELLDVNRWSRSGGITITNMNSEVLQYNLGGQWTLTDSYYKSNEGLNRNTLLHNYFIDVTLTVWKKWQIGAGYNYNLYSSDAFAANQELPLMEFSLSRYILPNDRGQIIFSVFDVLDENRGLSRNSEINYIEEIRSNSIGRYGMLSFIYNLRGAGQDMPGGVRMIQHHR